MMAVTNELLKTYQQALIILENCDCTPRHIPHMNLYVTDPYKSIIAVHREVLYCKEILKNLKMKA